MHISERIQGSGKKPAPAISVRRSEKGRAGFCGPTLGSFDLLTPRTSPRPSSYRSVAVNMRVDNLIPLNDASRPHRNFARQRRNHASATILRARLHRRCVEFGWRTPEGAAASSGLHGPIAAVAFVCGSSCSRRRDRPALLLSPGRRSDLGCFARHAGPGPRMLPLRPAPGGQVVDQSANDS